MLPVYSVDRESYYHAHLADEDLPTPRENTPLLGSVPRSQNLERELFMPITVSLLLIVLVIGAMIGIYLLVVQSNSENVLPPIEIPLQLVSRKQWDPSGDIHPVSNSLSKAKQVIIVQTDTDQCLDTYSCVTLLRNMKSELTTPGKFLPYNFLVSTNGETYEGLGWHQTSPLFAQYPNSLILAFIGNFTEVPPSRLQVDEARNLFAESISQQHLDPSYIVFAKNTTYYPKYLYESLKILPRWNSTFSDA